MGKVVRFKKRRRTASTDRQPAKPHFVRLISSLLLVSLAATVAVTLVLLSRPVYGCRIKGNINEVGEHIYHMPGQDYYDETVVRPERGERWFCSQLEALWAGWRRAKV